jgi:hypothetical protein
MRQENGKPYFAFTIPEIIEVVEDESKETETKNFSIYGWNPYVSDFS